MMGLCISTIRRRASADLAARLGDEVCLEGAKGANKKNGQGDVAILAPELRRLPVAGALTHRMGPHAGRH